LAVQQALYNLESSRAALPNLRIGLEGDKNRLAVLTGAAPGALHRELQGHRPIPVTPLTVAVGVPAEALRRRPDVRRSERLLAAASARIGVATADLYPKLRLSGAIGLESLTGSDLFLSSSRFWQIGPSVTWNIFDAGAIRRNIEIQSALQEQALYQYETSVLLALEEVENALTGYAEEQIRRESLTAATIAAQRAVDLAQDQYKVGLVDFSNVLDAQRALLVLQDQLVESSGNVTANLVRLYKALGGGWTSLAAAAEPGP
jgi:NodT family efflux transporter outer membrane factor (OMF) lipoprotein